jgi:hypothetical protein
LPCEGRGTYLLHAIEAINAILSYTRDGRYAFLADRKMQDAAIRNIEIIGQAVKGISDGTRALEPDVPWRQIAGCATSSCMSTSVLTWHSSGMNRARSADRAPAAGETGSKPCA